MLRFILIFLFAFQTNLFSQVQTDTSYTVWSAYQKDIKKYPFIKIAHKPERVNVTIIPEIPYRKIGARHLHLDAFLNKNNTALPAVVLLHGGGWKSGNKSQTHLLAQEIAAKGYNCFSIEYRLSPEAQYPAGMDDVLAAISFIKQNAVKFNIDTTRTAILGCSSGGQMAALTGSLNNSKNKAVQAVVDMDGILAFHHPESAEGKVASEWLGGTYQEKPEVWEEASALTHTGKNMPPILFINSDKQRFHAGREDMISILNRYGIYSEIHTLENAPHSFWFFDPWFDEIKGYTVAFLDKILKQK